MAVKASLAMGWRSRRGDFAALAVIIVIGAGLRAAFLDRIVREDEAITYLRYVSKPFIEAVSTYDSTNNHPLHTILAQLSVSTVGNQPWSLRLPVFLAGILIIPATYVWAANEYGRLAGVFTASLAASSSFLVDYSTRARGYSIATLLFIVALILAQRLVKQWDIRTALAMAVVNAFALYTFPIAVFPVGMALTWLAICLVIQHREKDWMPIVRGGMVMLIVTGTLTLILYGPILLSTGLYTAFTHRVIVVPEWPTYFSISSRMLALLRDEWVDDIPSLLAGIMAACYAASLVTHRKIAVSAIPLAVTAVILVVLPLQRAIPYARIFMYLVPIYLGGVAGMLIWTVRWLSRQVKFDAADRWIRLLAVATTVGLGGIVYSQEEEVQWDLPAYNRASVSVSIYLAGHVQPGDGLAGHPRAIEVVGYYLDTYGQPVVLTSNDFVFAYIPERIPSRLFVLTDHQVRNPLRIVRYYLGQNKGFDPTAYNVPKLIQEIGDLYIYEVNKLR